MSIIDIVKPQELSKIIKCADALSIYENLIDKFSTSKESAEYLRLKSGIAQELVDEFAPLCIYAYRCHGNSTNLMKYCYGTTQSFDGEILNAKSKILEQVEITCAIDGHCESIRMECLNKEGMVNAFGSVNYTGLKGRREFIDKELESVSSIQLENYYLKLIEKAYLKKKKKIGKYDGMTLLIAIEAPLIKENNMDSIINRLSLSKDRFNTIFLVNTCQKIIRVLAE